MDKDSYLLQEFGTRLAELRKQKGISQEKLALESGLARSYLSGVERGQRNISLLNIYKIANTLDIDIACFFNIDNKNK
ncbi:helix-turn-helix domain-containing protein [Acinetobacter baumannii]|uniref:helix-turn-helix domain-containing protein n=1 Tax=Acinetobacter baumannii TaxID=470 RepID=UPI002705DC2B|nr:helix-turn-helix transcriptional regulator [Acinetobacter baumannii]MDO7420140.1 helix-turn-helix transcriptional regulator [Acinetobacter baumannii]MDV4329998.1 helix-turn-helix transcriptional regulator [Acinetobacter baumannii]MDV4333448.1 helix-turn-helix transcriptional regulator [Acinetobacter baumannii]HCA5044350.1 helix-turn-helix transcriptional regulator [Acinetobacter baumannii]